MSQHSSAPLLGSPSLSPSPAPVSPSQAQWESLRKKSRLLETQLYKKLQELSQIQTQIMNEGRTARSNARALRADSELSSLRATPSPSSAAASSSSSSSSAASSSASVSPLLHYETCSSEVGDLLRSSNDAIEAMARLLSEHAALNTDANAYVLSRARTQFAESSTEFRRTQGNIQAALARAELMSGASARRSESSSSSVRGRTEQLLREEQSLSHSLSMADDVIASAMSARDSLLSQGNVFGGVRQKLTQLNTAFPVVGQLMNKISMKHNRDMVVLAIVIASCMIFTFLYIAARR